MRRSASVVAAVAVAVGALVSSCSGAGAASGTGASGAAEVQAIWHRFAVCARAHGAPGLPEPVVDASGSVTFPGSTAKEPDSVRRACNGILDALPPRASQGSDHPPTDIAALLRFAQCMRQHGLPDFPDPKADGTFPAAQLPPIKTPAVIDAMRACDRLNPDRGGHIYGS